MDTDKHGLGLKNNALPFQPRVFEIYDQTDSQLRYAEIVQHLTALMIGYPVNHFGVHNHRTERYQVRDKLTNLLAPKQNRKVSLLIESDPIPLKQNHERILVYLLAQPVTDLIQNLEGKAN